MKIYTKTGDKGKTSLLNGKRVAKNHVRIETYGTVDELNAQVGLLRSSQVPTTIDEELNKIQHLLFSVGSILALDDDPKSFGLPLIEIEHIQLIEAYIDAHEQTLPELKNFILPGGHQTAALAHVCRTTCRRAERLVVQLASDVEMDDQIITFLNRLSDYFFVVSRALNKHFNEAEHIWDASKM